MADSLNPEAGEDFGKTADAFEAMARGIKAQQRGLAAGGASSAPAPAAPEQVWATQFGYRAIAGGEGGDRRMAVERHGPLSWRPAPLPDVSALKPVLPQFREPVAMRAEVAPLPDVFPAAPTLTPSEAVFQRPATQPKRSLLARLFGG